MKDSKFNAVIDDTLNAAREMLTRKSSGYSTGEDRLKNFRTGAALNNLTMEQVCWGMATKHIVSIRDMVMSGATYSAEVWDEKLGDAINYLAILKAITVETDPQTKVLEDLRDNLVGSDFLERNQHVYSSEVSPPMTQQQRDIASIKRVADKNK